MHIQFQTLIEDSRWEKRVFVLNSHNGDENNLLALGVESEHICYDLQNESLDELQNWLNKNNDWVFGLISYDIKNGIEKLQSRHTNDLNFPYLHFVKPKVVIRYSSENFSIEKNNSDLSESEFRKQLTSSLHVSDKMQKHPISLQAKFSKEKYLQAVNHLKQHIQLGEIYEVSFCQEFFARKKIENPFQTWLRLNEKTQAPFSAFIQTDEKYLMCASPERFLKKEKNKLLSQPIKGTVRRGKNEEEDNRLKIELYNSEKERSENVMIVDLVRNDLSRIAKRGSVRVEELFGMYTFETVHHLISSVAAEINADVSFTDLLRATFPMGSMTGAPKVRAMQLIEEFEISRRGLFSGSVGYIRPNGDFDFNVVIRSLLCNNSQPYISCSVGSAITAMCDTEKEYEECLLKAEAILSVLGN